MLSEMASTVSGVEGGVHRTFYQLPASSEPASELPRPPQPGRAEALLQYVREQTIGRARSFLGPFGSNTAVYCDHTASGKSLRFIEDYIRDEVLPTYANTHTTSTHSALQTTSFRDEARLMVRNSVQASEHDAVIFCGSGATSAVHKLIRLLQLSRPPTVLVGPHEHHSNLLPWREIAAKVVRVAEDPVTGGVSLSDLELQLSRHPGTPDQPLVVCLSGASNVTGVLANDAELTAAVHRHGGLAIWDYATAAPYVRIAMNPVVPGLDAGLTQKDALLFSPHKFIGGVQTPGVLVVKKRVVANAVPDGGGGGTVFFVRRDQHRYLQDVESREEGGTPGIVESVRAGLVMQLKEALGPERIRAWDDSIVRRFLKEARAMSRLALLGPRGHGAAARLPVFSFLVSTPSGGFLHHNFVTALLNDLFGVQARGGCACAGPYAQDLLGIDEPLAARFEHVLVEDSRLDRTHLRRQGEYSSYELLRPGFTRLTLSYLLSDEELEHTIEALRMVCEHGWKLLPQYRVNPETGEWRHHSNLVLKERRWLGDIKYSGGRLELRRREHHPSPPSLANIRARALQHMDAARKDCPRQVPDHGSMFDSVAAELRWFLLPNEAKLMLNNTPIQLTSPFRPRVYPSQAPRSAPSRRRALSESGPSEDVSRPPRVVCDTPVTPAPSPASPASPGSPAASGGQYCGSLDRERGRAVRAAVTAAAAASAPAGSPLRHQPLKQRAMSVSCSTDRRLSDTRFLAQELANLFSSGQRSPPPAVTRRIGSLSPTVPPAAVVNAAIRRIVSAGQAPPVAAGDGSPRSSPDGAEAGAAASPEDAVLTLLQRQASLSPVLPQMSPRTPPHGLTGTGDEQTQGTAHSPDLGPVVAATVPAPVVEVGGGTGDGRVKSEAGSRERRISVPTRSGEPLSLSGGECSLGISNSCSSNLGSRSDPPSTVQRSAVVGVVSVDTSDCSQSNMNFIVNSSDLLATTDDSPMVASELLTKTPNSTMKTCDSFVDNSSSPMKMGASSIQPSNCQVKTSHLTEKASESSVVTCDRGGAAVVVDDPVDSSTLICGSGDVHSCVPNSNVKPCVVTPTANGGDLPNSSVSGEPSTSPTNSATSPALQDIADNSSDGGARAAAKLSTNDGPKLVKGNEKQKTEKVPNKGTEPAGPKWHAPPRSLYKKAAEAMSDFSMLRPGDRVLVCLSGGKDSLSLLHVLRQHQFVAAAAGTPFQLAAVTVDPQSSAYDPRPLVPYLAKLGVPYFYEVQGILQLAEAVDCSSICSFCSRMKRGRLYAAARRQGYNVLAFGQHLDDISESFLMSVFHNGRLRTMKACYSVTEEDLRVIRPLIYVREKELRHFAESRKLPIIPENCPACFEKPKERHRVKQLLAQQEVLFPRLFESLRSAMRPLYAISRTGLESRLFGRAGSGDVSDGDVSDDDDVMCGDAAGDRCTERVAEKA